MSKTETSPFEAFFVGAASAVERQIAIGVDEVLGRLRRLAVRDIAENERTDDLGRWAVDGWEDEVWSRFPPSALTGYVPLTRIGTVQRTARHPGCAFPYDLPALVPVLGQGNVVFSGPAGRREESNRALQSLVLRLLATTAPGKVRFTLIDAAGFGQNFASVMELPELVRGAQSWHHPRDIERELAALTEILAKIVQKYLTNQYNNIVEYNRDAGVVAEAFRVLAIANLPAGFNDRLWNQVVSLAENGPRAGIHVIATLASDEGLPHKCDAADLLRHSMTFRSTKNGLWKANEAPFAGGEVALDDVDDKLSRKISAWVTDKGRHADRVRVDFAALVPAKPWAAKLPTSEDDAVEVAIGRYGARDEQLFRLQVGTTQHALVGGMAGSGKSVLLHVLILGLALKYRPEDLELYLIDLKEGVEFVPYKRLPHARVVATETEREFALSVLRSIAREMERRGAEFRRHGVENLKSWHARTLGPMPVIVVVMDEFQVLLDRADRVCITARTLLDDFARRGRGFGIHLVLATQSLASVEIEPSTLNQLGVRIALRMPESDSFRVLAKDNDAAAHLERAGQAVYNDGSGQRGRDKPFQVAFLERAECMARIEDLVVLARKSGWSRQPIVFDGAAAAKMDGDATLVAVWKQPPTSRPKALALHVGEPVAVSDRHTHARLRRQGRSNLLIVGSDEEDTIATFAAACVSACLFAPARTMTLQVLDLTNVDSPHNELLDGLAGLRQEVTIAKINQRKNQSTIDVLAAEVEARLHDEALPRPTKVLAVFGIQRLRELQKGPTLTSAAGKQFSRIIHDGPDVGIHTIITADSDSGLGRVLDGKDLEAFDSRIALQGGDSTRLFGEHSATVRSLRRHYGVLYELESPDAVQKFKCYEGATLGAFLQPVAG